MKATLFFALSFCSAVAHAAGLGQIQIQSSLGESLRAKIPVLGTDNGDTVSSCIRAKLVTIDGEFIGNVPLKLMRNEKETAIFLSSTKNINEPALTVIVEMGCQAPIVRDYQVLLDPPTEVITSPLQEHASIPVDSPKYDVVLSKLTQIKASDQSNGADARRIAASSGKRSKSATSHASLIKTAPDKLIPKKNKAPIGVLKLANSGASDAELIAVARSVASAGAHQSKPIIPEVLQKTDALPARTSAPAASAHDQTNGSNSTQTAESKLLALQSQILDLELRAAKLKQSATLSVPAVTTKNRIALPESWFAFLIVILLGCIGAIGWLIKRVNELKSNAARANWSSTETATQIAKQPTADIASQNHPATKSNDKTISNITLARFKRHDMPKVEEVSDYIQQAEFWMSLQRDGHAIELLEASCKDDNPGEPIPWLYLFDLYRELGDKGRYMALRTRFQRIFNGKIPLWDETPDAPPSGGLENLPELMKTIASLWKTDDIIPFLENLLIDNREGERAGFDLTTYREISFLASIAYEHSQARKLARSALQ